MDLLKKYPHLRDSDFRLIANIWNKDMITLGLDPKKVCAFEFFERFSNGHITNPESIRRIRQKIQEEFPELRGKNYKARQKEQDVVKEDLFTTPELYRGGTP